MRRILGELRDSPVEAALAIGVSLVVFAFWPDFGRRMLALPGALLVFLAIGPARVARTR